MATWAEFAATEPQLAAWGESRFNRSRVAFIATVAADGSPRCNPVQPVICEGRLLLFIEPTSPKVNDLKIDGRYAIHSLIDNPVGLGGEFSIKGTARLITDDEIRQQGIEVSCFTPSEEYVLFELSIDAALRREYEDGKLSQHRWDEAPVPA
jgi:hypothetical protein